MIHLVGKDAINYRIYVVPKPFSFQMKWLLLILSIPYINSQKNVTQTVCESICVQCSKDEVKNPLIEVISKVLYHGI